MVNGSGLNREFHHCIFAGNKIRYTSRKFLQSTERRIYMWTKPTAQDKRFGFEVTMYIAAR